MPPRRASAARGAAASVPSPRASRTASVPTPPRGCRRRFGRSAVAGKRAGHFPATASTDAGMAVTGASPQMPADGPALQSGTASAPRAREDPCPCPSASPPSHFSPWLTPRSAPARRPPPARSSVQPHHRHHIFPGYFAFRSTTVLLEICCLWFLHFRISFLRPAAH